MAALNVNRMAIILYNEVSQHDSINICLQILDSAGKGENSVFGRASQKYFGCNDVKSRKRILMWWKRDMGGLRQAFLDLMTVEEAKEEKSQSITGKQNLNKPTRRRLDDLDVIATALFKVGQTVDSVLKERTLQRSAIGRVCVELRVPNSSKNRNLLFVKIRRNFNNLCKILSSMRGNDQIRLHNSDACNMKNSRPNLEPMCQRANVETTNDYKISLYSCSGWYPLHEINFEVLTEMFNLNKEYLLEISTNERFGAMQDRWDEQQGSGPFALVYHPTYELATNEQRRCLALLILSCQDFTDMDYTYCCKVLVPELLIKTCMDLHGFTYDQVLEMCRPMSMLNFPVDKQRKASCNKGNLLDVCEPSKGISLAELDRDIQEFEAINNEFERYEKLMQAHKSTLTRKVNTSVNETQYKIPKGFKNPYNVSCYANSALQALLCSNILRARLRAQGDNNALHALAVEYDDDSKPLLDSTDVRKFVGGVFADQKQQCAGEFIIQLSDKSRAVEQTISFKRRVFQECKFCFHKTNTADELENVLMIPNVEEHSTIEAAYMKLLEPSTIPESKCANCGLIGAYVTRHEFIDGSDLIVLLMMNFDNCMQRKRPIVNDVPQTKITMSDGGTYAISAAIFQVGGVMSGHYWAYVLVGNEWVYANDSDVKKETWPNDSKDLYLLVLKKLCDSAVENTNLPESAYITSPLDNRCGSSNEKPIVIARTVKTQRSWKNCNVLLGDIEFDSSEWQQFFYNNTFVPAQYVHLLVKKFAAINKKGCTLNIKTYFIRQKIFATIYGYCGQVNCSAFKFVIKRKPQEGEIVIVSVYGTCSSAEHSQKLTRYVNGESRALLRQELKNKKCSTYRCEQVNLVSEESLDAGNLEGIKSAAVLRKIRSEALSANDLHANDFVDVFYKQLTQFDEITREYKYIQKVCSPLQVYVYSREQLEVLKYICKETGALPILFFDATGSVVRKMKVDRRKVLYYTGVIHSTHTIVPMLEMISSRHDGTTIGNFLACYKQYVEANYKWPAYSYVVADFSWAILIAISKCWNLKTISEYLQFCYKYVTESMSADTNLKKKIDKLRKKTTLIHLCFAHLIKMMSDDVRKISKKEGRAIHSHVMEILAHISSVANYEVIRKLFGALFTIINSRYRNTLMINARTLLLEIPGSNYDFDDYEESELRKIDDDYPTDGPIYQDSPFYKDHFEHLINVRRAIKECESLYQETDELNDHYCPDLTELILNKYIPYLPMWTEIMSGVGTSIISRKQDTTETVGCSSKLNQASTSHIQISRKSNACVENRFGYIKTNVLAGDKNLKLGRFLEVCRKDTLAACKIIVKEIPITRCARVTNRVKVRKEFRTDQSNERTTDNDNPCVEEEWEKRGVNKKPGYSKARHLQKWGSDVLKTENLKRNELKRIHKSEVVNSINPTFNNVVSCIVTKKIRHSDSEIVANESKSVVLSGNVVQASNVNVMDKVLHSTIATHNELITVFDSDNERHERKQRKSVNIMETHRQCNAKRSKLNATLPTVQQICLLVKQSATSGKIDTVLNNRQQNSGTRMASGSMRNDRTIRLTFNSNGLVRDTLYYRRLTRYPHYTIGFYKLNEKQPAKLKLTFRDYNTLTAGQADERNMWLNDNIINACAFLVIQSSCKVGNHLIDSCLTSRLFENRGEMVSPISLNNFGIIFMPYNVNGNHWVLVTANIDSYEFSVLDPLRNMNESNIKQYLKKFKTFLLKNNNNRKCSPISIDEWKIKLCKYPLQQDGYNCGVYVLLYILTTVTRFEYPDKINMSELRAIFQKMLIAGAANVKNLCYICGEHNVNVSMHWLDCDMCSRWFHLSCLPSKYTHIYQENVAGKTTESVCPLCEIEILMRRR